MKKLKGKIDSFFGIDGCIESQIWYYGFYVVCGFVGLICLFARLQLH